MAWREQDRREQAGKIYQQHLDQWILTRGDPRVADAFVEELERLYRVRRWDEAAFDRAVVDGALRGWRPGSEAIPRASALRIVATSCPLGSVIDVDEDACGLCRSFQRHVVERTLPGGAVEFDELISKGASACETEVRARG